MDVKNRMQILRVLQEMDNHPVYSEKLGLKNTSYFKGKGETEANKIEVCSHRFGNESNR